MLSHRATARTSRGSSLLILSGGRSASSGPTSWSSAKSLSIEAGARRKDIGGSNRSERPLLSIAQDPSDAPKPLRTVSLGHEGALLVLAHKGRFLENYNTLPT